MEDRPGVGDRTHVRQLVGVEHRADGLDLPVLDVEGPGVDDLAVRSRKPDDASRRSRAERSTSIETRVTTADRNALGEAGSVVDAA